MEFEQVKHLLRSFSTPVSNSGKRLGCQIQVAAIIKPSFIDVVDGQFGREGGVDEVAHSRL